MDSKKYPVILVALVLAVFLGAVIFMGGEGEKGEPDKGPKTRDGEISDGEIDGTVEFEEVDNIDDLNETLGEIEDVYDDLDGTDAELDRLIAELEGIGIEDEF